MIEINDDYVDALVVKDLKETRDNWQHYLDKYKEQDHGFISIFSHDPEKDKKELKKCVKAINRVLDWYGA